LKTWPIVYSLTTAAVLVSLWCSLGVYTEQAEAEPVKAVTETTETTEPPVEIDTNPIEVDNPLNPYSIELLGRTIWGEAEGVTDKAEQAAVAWCILNRVDATGKSIEEVVTAPHQFVGFYRVNGEVPEQFLQLAEDVLNRWRLEQSGVKHVGRVLPAEYIYFHGDGARNHFRKDYQSTDYWDWSLKSPY
jgi:hypothetical protein